MSWFGKVVGGTLGFSIAGPLGAVIGGVIGNQFDKKIGDSTQKLDDHEEKQMVFFVSVFSMLAKIAGADGKFLSSEKKVIDEFMNKNLKLDKESRQFAIDVFNKAGSKNTSFEEYAEQFYSYFKDEKDMLLSMVDLMVNLAASDDEYHHREEKFIKKACNIFKISEHEYESIEAQYIAGAGLEKYYKILDLSPDAEFSKVKKRYRSMAKDYHPDNIIGKGLPEEFVDFAEEKFKKIQNAYEEIKKAETEGANI
jgi:DnaJ like chaperone protein